MILTKVSDKTHGTSPKGGVLFMPSKISLRHFVIDSNIPLCLMQLFSSVISIRNETTLLSANTFCHNTERIVWGKDLP